MSKSADQAKPHGLAPQTSDLDFIFDALQNLLSVHAPPFKLCIEQRRSKPGVHLVVPHPVVIPEAYGGQPISLSLADVRMQQRFVGFYFMPIYLKPELQKKLSPVLLKWLKGKTCFHLKAIGPELEAAIQSALELGTESYRDRGWV